MSFAAAVSDSRDSFFQPRRFLPRGRSLYRSALLIRSSPKARNGTPSLIGSCSAASRQLNTTYLGFSDLSSSPDAENASISLVRTLVRVPRDSKMVGELIVALGAPEAQSSSLGPPDCTRPSLFVKFISLTSCSTRTSATDTLTALSPWAIPATQSLPRIAASPWVTASYNVAAVTSPTSSLPRASSTAR
jgi:hypothetical protein